MEADFWRAKWEKGEIGFHGAAPNPLLLKHFPTLGLAPGSRVFLPLCGKTLDIHWLLAEGFQVAGAELSALAVEQLFAELGVEPEITPVGPLLRHAAEGIVIHQGDIFELDAAALGPVDGVYDRAALVALPADLRPRYAGHVAEIAADAPQLLIAYEYDQAAMDGPPFAVGAEEIRRLYGLRYEAACVEMRPAAMRDGTAATESVWRMKPLRPFRAADRERIRRLQERGLR